jgi:hypothetical protein
MATRKPMKFKRYDEGGSVEESKAKQRGLDISNKEEPVGFFERLRMGNIDQPGSEAYNRFGAGRAYAKTMEDEGEAMRSAQRAASAAAAPAASARPLSDDMYSDFGPSEGRSSTETVKSTRPAASKPTVPASKPASKPAVSDVPRLSTSGPMRGMRSDTSSPQYAGPMRGMRSDAGASKPAASVASQIPGQSAKAPQGEKIDSSEMSRNIENAMLATGAGGVGVAGLYKLGKMLKGGREAAGKVAPYLKELGTSAPKKLLEGPRKASKSSDVTDVVPKSAPSRSLTGPDKGFTKANESRDKISKSLSMKKPKKGLDESDTTGGAIGYKRGGKVMKYASGGMVSSASKRADGIATKGKTRCKIC